MRSIYAFMTIIHGIVDPIAAHTNQTSIKKFRAEYKSFLKIVLNRKLFDLILTSKSLKLFHFSDDPKMCNQVKRKKVLPHCQILPETNLFRPLYRIWILVSAYLSKIQHYVTTFSEGLRNLGPQMTLQILETLIQKEPMQKGFDDRQNTTSKNQKHYHALKLVQTISEKSNFKNLAAGIISENYSGPRTIWCFLPSIRWVKLFII